MRRRFLALALIIILLGGATLTLIFGLRYARSDQRHLTELYGDELELTLNYYFATLQTEAAFEQPQVYCSKVATGDELSRCITTQGIRTFHDTNKVVRIRVIDYRQDCAVAIAIYTAVGSTATDSFLFEKEDGGWKIAARAYAVGEFDQTYPEIPFECP